MPLLGDLADQSLGPYDPDPEAEGDLWFLPQRDEPGEVRVWGAPSRATSRNSSSTPLVDGGLWREAEAALAADLAGLAYDYGRLSERAASLGQGAVQRLAHAEAAGLSWWTGDRIGSDRLALWLAFHIGATGLDGDGLIRASWAARRLMAPPVPPGSDLAATLAQVVHSEDPKNLALATEVAAVLEAAGPLHPITRGAALFHLWHGLGERPDHLRGLEAAILASRLSVGQGRDLPFVPLSLIGFAGLTASGSPERRLAAWIAGAHGAVLAAMLELDRLMVWSRWAEQEIASLSGRTPARLIACLAAHPMVAAPQAEVETGASRAAVQRNLDLLVNRNLVREVTGQGRFRVWAAKL